jgi:hypothetical protein
LLQTHWRILARTSAADAPSSRTHALEIERTLPLSPEVELYPLLTLTLVDYRNPSEVPGAILAIAIQDYDPAAASTRFRALITSAAAWPPTHVEALRLSSQLLVVGSAGYLYADVAHQLLADLKVLAVAGVSEASARYSTRHAQLTESERIAQSQRLLQLMGFYRGPLDSHWGPLSRAAMEAFQALADLPLSGAADSLSLAALTAEAAHYTP